MKVGIIGGGLTGLALGSFLAEYGHEVTVLEQTAELGGHNGEWQFSDGLRVSRSQHPILPSDRAVRELCTRMGLEDELVFTNARTGFVHQNQVHPMSSIFDFLSFPVLGIKDRFRLGGMILQARLPDGWQALDSQPARDWLIRSGGTQAFERIWKPLLEAKFDGAYDSVSAVYIWSWLNRMSGIRRAPQMEGSIGYLRRGHYSLIAALAADITRRGGRVETNVRVREIEVSSGRLGRIRTLEGALEFDAVAAAVASPSAALLLPGASPSYLEQLQKSKYLGLICPVLVLKQPLSGYWTLNLTDPAYPFATIIETPHPERPEYSVVYLPRYIAPDNDWMGVSDEVIREAWLSHLKLIFPQFDPQDVVHFAVSRSRYTEPVYSVNMRATAPAVQTPYAGLFLVNTMQVYPALPTAEAIITHARRAAALIHQGSHSPIAV